MGQMAPNFAGDTRPPMAVAARRTRWQRAAPWLAAVAIGLATVSMLGLLYYLPSHPLWPVHTGTSFGPAPYVLAVPALVALLIVSARDWRRGDGSFFLLMRQAAAFGSVLAAAFLLQQIFAAMAAFPISGLVGPSAIASWLAVSPGFGAGKSSWPARDIWHGLACWAGFIVPFWVYMIDIVFVSLSTPPQRGSVGCHTLSPLPFIVLGIVWAAILTFAGAVLVAFIALLGGWLRRGGWR